MHADAVEAEATVGSGVRVGGRAGLPGNVAFQRGKRGLGGEVRCALKEVSFPADTLSTDLQAGRVVGHREHFQHGEGTCGIGSGYPLLPVVHAVAIGVSEIR